MNKKEKKNILIVDDQNDVFITYKRKIERKSEYLNDINEIIWAQSFDSAKQFIDDHSKYFHLFVLDVNIPKDDDSSEINSLWCQNLYNYLNADSLYGPLPNVIVFSGKSMEAVKFVPSNRLHTKGEGDFIEKFDHYFKGGNENDRIIDLIGPSFHIIGEMLGNSGRKELINITKCAYEEKTGEISSVLVSLRKIRDNLLEHYIRKTEIITKESTFVDDKTGMERTYYNYDNLIFTSFIIFLSKEEILSREQSYMLTTMCNDIVNRYGSHQRLDKNFPQWLDFNIIKVILYAICNLAITLNNDIKKRERSGSLPKK